MKRKVFLAVALLALMAAAVFAQTEADFTVRVIDGKSIQIIDYKGSATTVNIPAKIKNLPVISLGSAFHDTNITSVTIPNSVTEIEMGAFQNCSKLVSVTIPNSITGIWDNAFRSCTSLASITIPNSVKTLGDNAFRGCTSLTKAGKISSTQPI